MICTLLGTILPFLSPLEAVVTDVEGTTTSIEFVHETLFPYAKAMIPQYVREHQDEPDVASLLREVQEIADVSADEVVGTLWLWMDQDKKITPLKSLQGMIWEEGYRSGAIQGHVYSDAAEQLASWEKSGFKLYVYSSGSVRAQELLFSYSTCGDISGLFSGYFDTHIGQKKESNSYSKIAKTIGISAENILFLSDSFDELNAARKAGMQTILVCRGGEVPPDVNHPVILDFFEVVIPCR